MRSCTWPGEVPRSSPRGGSWSGRPRGAGHGSRRSCGLDGVVAAGADDGQSRRAITGSAAGGIADGRGLAAALALGAEGVLLGTRFMATPEAPIHANYKQAIVKTDGHDTVLTEIPDLASQRVWPGRCRGLSATSSSNDGQGVNGPCVKMRAKSASRPRPRVQQAMLKTPHFHSVKMQA